MEIDLLENFPTAQSRATFEQMLDDWTNEGFDPFAAPQETGSAHTAATATIARPKSRAHERLRNAVWV